MADLRLTDSMNPAESLLDTIGIPGQVIVHHQVRTLQIDSFAGRISRKQYLNFRIVPKTLLRIHAVFAAHTPMDHNDSTGPTQKGRDFPLKIIQSIAVLCEDNQLLGGRRYDR